MDLYSKTTFPEEQRNLMLTLGEVKDPRLHAEVREWALWSGAVRLQDIAYPLSTLGCSSQENSESAWKYFQENHDRLKERFGGEPRIWGSIAALLSRGGSNGSKRVGEIRAFFEAKGGYGSAKRRVEQSCEGLLLKEARLSRDGAVLKAFEF